MQTIQKDDEDIEESAMRNNKGQQQLILIDHGKYLSFMKVIRMLKRQPGEVITRVNVVEDSISGGMLMHYKEREMEQP